MTNSKIQLWLNYWIPWAQSRVATPSTHFYSSKWCCHSINSLGGCICGLWFHYKPEAPLGSRHLSTEQAWWQVLHLDLKAQDTGWSRMSKLSHDANSIAETSRNNLSATIKPGTLHNDTLCFTFKDNAPNLMSVGQMRNLFFFDAVIYLGCFTYWLRQKGKKPHLWAVLKPNERA